MGTTVAAELAFTHARDVSPDPSRPGLMRARPVDLDDAKRADVFDRHRCQARDCAAEPPIEPNLGTHGFSHLDLGHLPRLQRVLEDVRRGDRVDPDQAKQIRQALSRGRFRLPDGRHLRVLHIAPEGFIMRRAGPGGARLDADGPPDASNHHHAALAVHVDQDIDGTPVRQILRGWGPRLFHHDSPLHANRRSPLHLLNLWIPLQQVTAPLALLDVRTLDRPRHQLRFGLPVDDFMERPADRRVNDIWTLLHHPDQRWYFDSSLGPDRGWLFETSGTPHAAFTLPGEAAAATRWHHLQRVRAAVRAGDTRELPHTSNHEPMRSPPSSTTLRLRAAIDTMDLLLQEATAGLEDLQGPWLARADAALDALIRKSVEMRLVALVTGRSSRSSRSSA